MMVRACKITVLKDTKYSEFNSSTKPKPLNNRSRCVDITISIGTPMYHYKYESH